MLNVSPLGLSGQGIRSRLLRFLRLQRLTSGAREVILTNGQLEFVKWFAVVCMVFDHVNLLLLDQSQLWMFQLGRLAFPLFMFCFAEGLSRASGGSFDRACRRVLVAALVCQPITMLVRSDSVLNVFFQFLAVLLVYRGVQGFSRGYPIQWLAVGVGVALSCFSEFGLLGLVAGLCGFVLCSRRDAMGVVCWVVGVAGLSFVNGSYGALGAVLVVLFVRELSISLPRARDLLYLFYPMHFLLIGLVRTVW